MESAKFTSSFGGSNLHSLHANALEKDMKLLPIIKQQSSYRGLQICQAVFVDHQARNFEMGAASLGGVMTLHILPKESTGIMVGEELYMHKAEVTYIVRMS